MKESSAQRRRRRSNREIRRIRTTKLRHGADFYHRNGKQAGKLSTTKFSSETASIAAKKRWAKQRREKGA